ncbi:MAG TPA: class I SAM-dependent methyltransferase [Ktedonobacterales bacterium]|nr:class I SAM-dependent methyltransferase [Ktedonobacterales bacterium]
MERPRWFLDELAYAGPEHRDPAYVAGYDQKTGFDPAEDLALLRARGLGAASTLVDLGAGTGTFALAAAAVCERVIAVDVSPVMLAILGEKAEQLGVRNVERVQAGFLSYEHRGAPADFVYSRHALHHLSDFWKALALARIAALLRPGGVLLLRDLIFSFDLSEAEQAIETWLASVGSRVTDARAGWTRAELEEHLRGEYSTFSWLLEPMIERAGFEISDALYSSSGIYTGYLCVRRGASSF